MPKTPVAKRPRDTKRPRTATTSLTTSDVQPRRSLPTQRRQKCTSPHVRPRRESIWIKNRQKHANESGTAETPQEQVQQYQDDTNDRVKTPEIEGQQSQDGQSPPIIASPESQHQATPPAVSGSESFDYSTAVWKVYLNGELYSIRDRKSGKYIYHVHQHASRGYTITYSNKICTAIHNKAGNLVYSKL